MARASRRRPSSPVAVPEEEVEVEEHDEEEVGDGATEEVGHEDMEDDEEHAHDTNGAIARLRFNQPLNWKAGRSIGVADLLRRLDSLARELQGYEQDEVVVDSLQTAAKELASPQLLAHKDKGVKALTASCVVDIFRLCAPNAPYTQQQMKDIFTLIVTDIFPALADPSNAYNRQHLHVLRSLAEVKSIILLTDTPGAPLLIERLFKECFDVLGGPSKSNSNEELSKNVEHHMTAVLTTLVDESDVLPNAVTYSVLGQFLRTSTKVTGSSTTGRGKKVVVDEHQGVISLKEAPPAYNMAKNICNASSDKMARNITRYWSSVVSEASMAMQNGPRPSFKRSKRRVSDDVDDDDEEEDVREAAADMEDIRRAHDLLRELWRATPNVLSDIIPLLENELSEENVQKRQLAVETVGDMIAGIGHAGPPSAAQLNPAAYPSQSLIDPSEKNKVFDFLTTPTSPIAFITRYHNIFQAFLLRRHDKSTVVRATWATAVGRIILTSAGGVGLSTEDEQVLAKAFANCLMDTDEKVRHNVVKVIERFDYDDIVNKLGNQGGVDDEGSILANLAERVKDRKKDVRNDTLRLLGRMWGVAVGAIGEGSERTEKLLGSIPSKILGTYYINDIEISTLVDKIVFESLLPLSYPPIKSKATSNGESQRNQRATQRENTEANPDKLRTERILLLTKGLDEKAKTVFFAMSKKQIVLAKYMEKFLEACERFNGGVSDDDEDKVAKEDVQRMVEAHTRFLPEGQRVTDDMWKFAKVHDRRCYALIRFCMAPESDYKKVKNAYFELTKKLDEIMGTSLTFVDTMSTLVLRASVLVYNRSHVQSIIEISRSDEGGLGKTAHLVLGNISKDKPDVFKAHVQELCKSLESEAPSAKRTNEAGAVQDLKACAQFARQFPKDVPKDRKFIQALFGFINYGAPAEAAKYGSLIILLVADKKALYAKDIFKQCTDGFVYGEGNFLNRLAALSQLMLLGSEHLENEDADVIVSIAINDVLANKAATPAPAEDEENPDWTDVPDDNCAAKMWALKILVNRLRAFPDNSELDDAAKPVFQFVNQLIQEKGQTARDSAALAAHQSRMRLAAAKSMLKLCREKHLSARLSPSAFNSLALVAQDSRHQVRWGFVTKIMKYLGQVKLSSKFYVPLFLLGHEPEQTIKSSVTTWLKGRAQNMSIAKDRDTTMEAGFARLLSLLAHHPDWPADAGEDTDIDEVLSEFTVYIIFYLHCVGNANNLGLVYHVAQRVKGHQDGIVAKDTQLLETVNERLYMLSDLAQGLIRRFLEHNGWTLQAWPGKVKMPAGIFRLMDDVEQGREVAMKNYLPNKFEEGLDEEVRRLLSKNTKKRKSTAAPTEGARKKVKTETGERKIKKTKSTAPKKTPKKSRLNGILSSDAPSSEIRRSGRGAVGKSYIEVSSDEEEAEEEDEEMPDVEEDEAEASEPEEEQSKAGAEPSSKLSSLAPDEVERMEDEDAEEEQASVSSPPPTHSSPVKRTSTRPTSKKVTTPKKAPPTPKKTVASAGKSVNGGSAKKTLPIGKGKAGANKKEKVVPARAKVAAKANGAASRGLRASKRGKAIVDEFDMPDSD